MQSAVPLLTRSDSQWPGTRAIDSRSGLPLYVYAVVFSSLCIVVGLLWDIMWHMSIGRDGLFAPPHLVMYVGAVVSGLFSGYQILNATFSRNAALKAQQVRFWGVFYGSLGALYCVWGALAMLTSAPFDDWWHNTYGLDVQILTPPHTVLVLGMMMVQFGAMIGVLSLQNQVSANVTSATTPALARLARRAKGLFIVAGGLLLSVWYVLFSEEISAYKSHHSSYYVTAALIFPVFMLAIGRASGLRWPLTTLAVVYLLTLLLPAWIIQLLPATPRLGPVLNPITHYQPIEFPPLLVIPAYLMDRLLHYVAGRQPTRWRTDWTLAVGLGLVFVTSFLAVQWPFGEFLLTSVHARNYVFLGYSWVYAAPPDWAYRHAFHPTLLQSLPQFLPGLGLALVVAVLSARVGLLWGNWMKRVQR